MAHSPHRRWRGHCMLCKGHKDTRQGDAGRTPWAVLRQVGKKRRWNRNDVSEA